VSPRFDHQEQGQKRYQLLEVGDGHPQCLESPMAVDVMRGSGYRPSTVCWPSDC